MDIDSIRELLKNGESETVEAKSNPNDIASLEMTACAFANTKGGYIIIGVEERHNPPTERDRFRYDGITAPRGLRRQLESIGSTFQPAITVEVDQVSLGNNQAIFVVSVLKKKTAELVSLKNGVTYRRKGATTAEGEIFKPKTAAAYIGKQKRSDEIAIIKQLIASDKSLISASEIATLTGIELARVEAQLERMEKASLFRKTIRTNQGLSAEVSGGDRLLLDERLEELQAGSLPESGMGTAPSKKLESETEIEPARSEIDSQKESAAAMPSGPDTIDHPEITDQAEAEFQNKNRNNTSSTAKNATEQMVADSSASSLQTSGESNTEVSSKQTVGGEDLEDTLFVDNSDEAVQIRTVILKEFENLPTELQLSFAATQLGPGPIQHEWKQSFIARLNNSNAARLNRISVLLSEFSARDGRYIGDHCEYRRDANELEECLNLSKYVVVLARFFSSTRDDVCFGLFGHWGRGKTHLMRRVGEQLAADHNYQVVRFSAWKYRTNPELWIHLYQSMARTMRNSDFFVRLFVPFRAGLSQHGVWPIIAALFFQAVALVPMKEKYWFAQYCLQLIGTAGIFYVFFFYLHVKRLGLRLSTYLQVADHSNKLGLQATIGDDLKALLMGWLPKFQWFPSPPFQANNWKATLQSLWRSIARISWLGLFCYLGITIWIFMLLSPEAIGKTQLLLIGQVDMSIPTWLIRIIQCIWLVFAIVFPTVALLLASGPKRILLIVDDLDRCPHEQILEIIESIMLLLDDDEIQRRLQVAVLVEEEAVHHAIAEKYRYLWHDSANSESDDIRSRVIQENLEKLFLVHLRLGPLNTAEIVEVADRYTRDGRQRPSDVGTILAKTEQKTSEPIFVRNGISDAEFVSPEPNVPTLNSGFVQKQTQEPLKLTELEMDVLLSELQLQRITRRTRWGPRSIRCLINKYLLARELLLEIHRDNMSDPRELAQALVSPDDDAKELEQKPPRFIELTEYKGAKYIARQVR